MNVKIQPHQVIALSGFLMFPIAVFGPLGYAVLFPVTSGLALLTQFLTHRKFASFPPRTLLLLGALHLWGLITTFWSVYQERTLELSGSLLILSLCGIALWKVVQTFTSSQRKFILTWMTVGFCIGLVFLGIESASKGAILAWIKSETYIPIYKFNKATTIVSIFIWPLAFTHYNRGRQGFALLLAFATIGVVFSLYCDSSKVALVFAGIAFILAYGFRRVPPLASWGLLFGILAMPLLTQTILKPETIMEASPVNCKDSLVHRLYVWDYVSQQIREKALLGWGLDTARSKQFSNDTVTCKFQDPHTEKLYLKDMPALLLHPHNAALQWWLELGLVGVIIASFLAMQVPWALRNWLDKPRRAAAFASYTTATLIAMTSYGIWQNWWISTLWLAVIYGHMILDPRHGRNDDGQKG